jgi:hypothetical protein
MNIDDELCFSKIQEGILNFDPVYWAENKLTINGKPFSLQHAWKPFADIYRYIGVMALSKTALPLILLKSRQTGGTVMANTLDLFFMDNFGKNRAPMRVVHAFPTKGIAESFSKTIFNPMCAGSIPVDVGNKNGEKVPYIHTKLDKNNSSIYFKQFANGNHLWIESTGLTGDRLRSKTADAVFYDEFQDISAMAVDASTPMLNQSQWGAPTKGIQIYFGTPKKKGSNFQKLWDASTQNYYYLGCEKCKEYFPLYTYGSDEWENVWIDGFIVKCTHCGFEQDKRDAQARGKWFGLDPSDDPNKIKFIGFHINQLYMPIAEKKDILYNKPENHPTKTERAYRNETLGEFFDGDSSPITVEDIMEHCGIRDRNFVKSIPSHEKFVAMGIDFGLLNDVEKQVDPDKFSQGSSYTAIVILVEEQPGLFFVAYAEKLTENTPAYKKSRIEYLMRQYSVDLCIGDIGYSNDISWELSDIYGPKYMTTEARGKLNENIRYLDGSKPPKIQFNKDYYYDEMIQQLKKGMVKFPIGPYTYDHIYWLMEHCSNLELKPTVVNGLANKIYVKKGPTDGFTAMLNAYIAYKYMATEGFTKMSPNAYRQKEVVTKPEPNVIASYIPFNYRY